MKKIIIIIAIVIVIIAIIGVAIFAFYVLSSEEEERKSKEEPESTFSLLKTGEIPYDQEYSYEIDTAEFIIYPMDSENFDFGYFEAYNNGEKIFASSPLYMISDIIAFEYDGNKYIIVTDFSGGAHCCFSEYIFVLTEDELKLLGEMYLGESSIIKENIIMQEETLYIRILDDRFAYFYTPYVTSYFFPQYLEVDPDGFEINNQAFKQDYLEEADRCENEIIEDLGEEFEYYSPLLVCIVANYVLAGEEDLAWQKFDEYSNMIPLNYYGQTVDLEQFKKELIELL